MTKIAMTSHAALALALISTATIARAADAPAPEAAAPAADAQTGTEIIVTGTRMTGITVAESTTPIKLVGEEAIASVGQANLNQVLTQLVPSFIAQAFGGDTANLTLSARLRGLSPNHALVLVNGKRRHGTANLAVLGGPYQGSASADLDLISPGSIKRIEVLEDGAAAQYGSDAIAGVINIILKDTDEGGDGYATAGKQYKTGGDTYAGSLHLGTKIGDAGFINLTLFHRFNNFTQVGGLDRRVVDSNGNLLSTTTLPALSAAQQALYRTMPGFPFVNKINGNAKSNLTNVQINSGYDFGTVQAYAFGTYSRRIASAYQNVRLPDRIRGSATLGVVGVLGAVGTVLPFPQGFSPREAIRQEDFAFTGGFKGTSGALRWDFSTTYARDRNFIYTLDSANASLFVDTGFTPRDFYNGSFTSTEFTANADFVYEVEAGMAAPLNIAFGGEYRKNSYAIGQGDAASIYKEGGQAYPGFRASDAGFYTRDNKSLYLDLSAQPVEALKLGAAMRFESYSDFGNNVIFKINGRYDFSDAFALRGTISTGFRAPTMAEQYYSATNVAPTSAFVQLPANSAAAKLIGFGNLRPEKSTNFSVGLVARPAPALTITLDAYQIDVRDRIVGTGSIFGSGGAVNFAIVRQAIIANGNVLDPTVAQTGINIFTNGADTRTRGADLTMSYRTDLGSAGAINWTLSANYNETNIRRLGIAPATLTNPATGLPITLFNVGTQSNLETASPKFKGIFGIAWKLGALGVNFRNTLYGVTSNLTSPDGGTYYRQTIPASVITDLDASFAVTEGLTLTVGANNLFDKRPPTVQLVPGTANQTLVSGGNVLDAPLTFSPYGINGGYYYAKVGVKF